MLRLYEITFTSCFFFFSFRDSLGDQGFSALMICIILLLLGDLGPSQSQKLAHEMRLSLTLINSSPTPSITDVG